MPTLTPDLIGQSIIASWIVMVFLIVFQVYMAYLNWKQAQVKDKTERVIEILEEISVKISERRR